MARARYICALAAFFCVCAAAEPNVRVFESDGANTSILGVKAGRDKPGSRAALECPLPKDGVTADVRAALEGAQKSFGGLCLGAGAARAGFFTAQNGEPVTARVFDFKGSEPMDAIGGETFALGRASIALVSLAALSAEEKFSLNLDAPVGGYFSALRSSGDISKVSIESLLGGTVCVGALAGKIPQDISPSEYFDALAQIGFVDSADSSGTSGAAIAAYALAYVFDTSSKDLKKSFVRSFRKLLWDPLRIKTVKYRRADKVDFPALAFALSPDGILKWLCCETSPNPPFSTALKIARRRVPLPPSKRYSHGWFTVGGTRNRACCTGGALAATTSLTAVFSVGSGSIGVSMFIEGVEAGVAEKIFKSLVSEIDGKIK